MRALTIIKQMVYDSAFAERADVVRPRYYRDWSAEVFVRDYFGCRIREGELFADNDYLCLYAVDQNECTSAVVAMGKPDVVLERLNPEDAAFDDQEVWLWKIE